MLGHVSILLHIVVVRQNAVKNTYLKAAEIKSREDLTLTPYFFLT